MYLVRSIIFALTLSPAVALADTQEYSKLIYQNFTHRSQIGFTLDKLSENDATDIQHQWVKSLETDLGARKGYKAGLTNGDIQKRFGVDHPVLGILLEKMILPSGSSVETDFGAAPMSEADLIVRVSCDDITKVVNHEEAANCIDEVYPFLELPDMMMRKDLLFNANVLIAINVGARAGIIGEPIRYASTANMIKHLGKFQVDLQLNQQSVGQGNSSNLLGHPLNVVLWIAKQAHKEQIPLPKGTLLSLGSLTNLFPIIPLMEGARLSARYEGLDPDKITEVYVDFKQASP